MDTWSTDSASLTFPCTIQDLPRDMQDFLNPRKSKYGRMFHMVENHPFETILYPKSMLAKPEFRQFIKDHKEHSYTHLTKWEDEKFQENKRMLASVPSDYYQNGIARFREIEEQNKKMADAIRKEIEEVHEEFEKDQLNIEVKEYLQKKKELQEKWFETFVANMKIYYNRDYRMFEHIDVPQHIIEAHRKKILHLQRFSRLGF